MRTPRAYQLARVTVPAIALVAALWLLLALAAPAQAAGVVTNCASDSDLRTKLAGGGLVTFNCNGTGSTATITLTRPLTLTAGQVVLDGGGKVTLSGGNTTRIFFLNGIGSLSFTLTHIVLARGYDVNAGGCLYVAADRVVLDDVTVEKCSTAITGEGGGIYNLLSDFQLVNSRVLSNSAGTGGGIGAFNAITLSNSLIGSNHAISGGGLDVRNGPAFISGSTFYSNSANLSGGGLRIRLTGRAQVVNSSLLSNTADGIDGGAGIHNGNRLSLSDSLLSGNRAVSGLGGGLNNRGTAGVSNTTFDGNVAGYGGGIHNYGSLTVTEGTLSANAAVFNGGGINNFSAMRVSASTFSGNSATFGGGIDTNGQLTVTDVTFNANTATYGGGIGNGYLATLTNVTLSGNRATQGGGGMFNSNAIAVANLTHVTLSGNAAPNGSGVYNGNSVLRFKSSIVAQNLSGDNCRTSPGTIASDDYNLSDDDSCTPHFSQAHDRNLTPAQLGPLADNGGLSLTHLPLAGSAAVDAIPIGANGCGTLIATDQRGVLRPQGNAKCDMGAVERQAGEQTPLLWLPIIRR